MSVNLEDFFDDEFPGDETDGVYSRVRHDPRTPGAIASLQKLGLDDHYIKIVFRLVSQLQRDWLAEKEAPMIADRRRNELASKLRKLIPEIAADSDISEVYFGANRIVSGGKRDPNERQFSLAECLEIVATQLESVKIAEETIKDERVKSEQETVSETLEKIVKEIPFKRYAILRTFDLLTQEGKRAPNKQVAQLVSLALDEEVTPNDVTQARKGVRKQYSARGQ